MRGRVVGGFAAVVVATFVAATGGRAAGTDSKAQLLQWYDLTASAAPAAGPEQSTQEHVWAVAWLAAARATKENGDPHFDDAALATALHDTLASLVPSSAPQADGQLVASLAAIPAGEAKDRGAAAGHAAAAAVLAERADDGYDTASVDRPWTPPAPAPGVYQLTGGPAVRAGLPDAKPFIIRSNDQFDPGPPPALTSQRYLSSLAEVRAYGGADSTVRTAAQTDTARWWAQASLVTYTQILREVLVDDHRPVPALARVVAAFHAIELDQQIAVHTAKYRYVAWRPVTAIADPAWTPLIATPRHPEYPSGHTAFGGTADVVLAGLEPSQRFDTFTATSSTDDGAAHSWVGWTAITDETIDARVWEGVHFRFSDETGAAVGRAVAAYDLLHLSKLGI